MHQKGSKIHVQIENLVPKPDEAMVEGRENDTQKILMRNSTFFESMSTIYIYIYSPKEFFFS